ncbi:MAG: hypothetical protein HRU27_04875, partial [Rhizobiaceae bacterium]|nr:hypothetical protein [Rhizobiaceae bacterium]
MSLIIRRLLDHPIISQQMSPSLGNNINGPSLIRVPDWVPNPLGRYYLYFAHHKGRSIRLAYADQVTGPWTIWEAGALSLEDSLFPHKYSQIHPKIDADDNLFDMGIADFHPHIASPDVHVDDANRQIRMYFHGMVEDGDQKTRLAVSSDGLRFEPNPGLFDHYYFRVFEYAGLHWALSWGGFLYRANSAEGPFERGPTLFEGEPVTPPGTILRHLAVHVSGDQLHLFFSRIGDTPEAIYHCQVALDPDWHQWQVTAPQEILRPVDPWEGALLPAQTSKPGVAVTPVHELRDPDIFRD